MVGKLMDRANLPCIISGDDYESDILVRSDRRKEVVKALKQDAQTHKYEITFY